MHPASTGRSADGSGGQQVGLEILRHAACAERRHLQTGYVAGAAEHVPPDGRHLVGLEGDVGAEGFSLNGEVHYHCGGSRAVASGQRPDGVEVHLAVAHGVDHAVPCHLDAWMGHNGHCRHLVALDDGLGPFGHVYLHQ